MKISKDNWVIVLQGNAVVYIDEPQFKRVKQVLAGQTPPKFIEVGDQVINTFSILYTMSAADYEEAKQEKEHKQRGDWKCESGNWHKKEYNDCSCRG